MKLRQAKKIDRGRYYDSRSTKRRLKLQGKVRLGTVMSARKRVSKSLK